MSGAIFLIQNNGQLTEMNEQGYDSEDLLQTGLEGRIREERPVMVVYA